MSAHRLQSQRLARPSESSSRSDTDPACDNRPSLASPATGTCIQSSVSSSRGSRAVSDPESVIPDVHCNTALTTATLAAYDAVDHSTAWLRSEQTRITRLQVAARDLGFELPRKDLEREEWDCEAWLKAQSGRQ
ncbi:hypothetical protein K491DRAFT_694922 [Lophiostoma macrostomum CBS 122681]|uniref:Uncharacterized protein n=1 Tax=Lophiostoma macrostomum CBS 122681 TaxID=1314788 RepID=A0A6A6T333_9PLEO|nr:hypothetical protein K491DRAFT_694922 [Lophiostoma macrostomum CBS 122681]